MISRGELWWADLPDPVASEPGYRRPVLIVQSDDFNTTSIHTVLAVSVTSNVRLAEAPGNVLLPAKRTGLAKDSVANVSQIVTVDKRFLKRRIHQLDRTFVEQVEDGLRLVLDL